MPAMRRFVVPLCTSLVLAPMLVPGLAAAQDQQDQGYFSNGEKQLTFREAGSRTKKEKIVLASVFGVGLLAGAVGTYYLFDSQRLSDEVSASGTHTGKTWSTSLEAKRQDALLSGTIATVGFSLASACLLAGAMTYIFTEPDDDVGYQDWQTRSFVAPSRDGVVAGQAWHF